MFNSIPFQQHFMVSHDFMVSDSLDLPAPEVSHALFERSLGTVTVLHRRCKLAEYSSQSNGLPVNTMEIRELVTRELSCMLLPSFPGSSQLSVTCSTEKILDTRCVFLSLPAVRYNWLHLCYHFQMISATSCISVITSRCPVQPVASPITTRCWVKLDGSLL